MGAAVLVQAQPACVPPHETAFRSISRAEIELLLADVAVSNPRALARFREDPQTKQEQIRNLRELMAFASAAVKEGHAADSPNCVELESIRDESIATEYDKLKNKARIDKTPFAHVSAAAISAFWEGTAAKPLSTKIRDARETGFKRFLDAKLELLSFDTPGAGINQPSDAEIDQARDVFAKIQIYVLESKARRAVLPASFRAKADLEVKLRQAQFLARRYAEVIVAATAASDEEVQSFIAADPALKIDGKKAKAEAIFERAMKGEDFASLANEFSEDPGNKGEEGIFHGGLYSGVKKGVMITAFEKAALASQPGQVFPGLVETDFGFHVIKLEKKEADDTYDVRHILISTMIKNSAGRDTPVKTFARTKIEDSRQKKLIDDLVAQHKITVAEDFSIPGATPVRALAKPAAKTDVRRTTRRRN